MITADSINTRLFRDISWNTLQVLANQFLGVFIFLLLSRYLDKDIYGELNWSLAILTLITTILSLRLEQIVVRNVAAGKDPSAMLTLFTAHNLVTGSVFFALLLAGHWLFPVFFHRHYILWILSISQLLTFFALPFRQLATGKSAFGWLAVISTVSNLIRCGWIGWLAAYSDITLPRVLVVFIISALVEFLLGGYIVTRQLRIPLATRQNNYTYRQLIRESLPQVGLVFLQAGIARIDWILMGFMSTPARTAEYSFAYRAYEFSPLPLLILAPFLLNSLSRYFSGISPDPGPAAGHPGRIAPPAWLGPVVRLQTVFATLLPLWLVLLWSPLVDYVTGHKYGQVNASTFLILSCCIPFQYMINIFWSAEFAANRLSLILKITAITGLIVVAGDCLLIPAYGGQGAALAYLTAMIVQYILYSRNSVFTARKKWGGQMILTMAIAIASGGLAIWLTNSIPLRLTTASILYGLLFRTTGRVPRYQTTISIIKKRLDGINWPLLLFLVAFLNVKLVVKIAAILFAAVLHRKDPIPRDLFRKKWIGFYLSMPLIAGINLLTAVSSLSVKSGLAFTLGCGYWIMAMVAAWHIYLFVRQEPDKEKLHRTVTLFFALNMLVILAGFLYICIDAGSINPYTYRGQHQKYFINTGDFISGISMDSSVTTALISAFGVFYFLYRGKKGWSLLSLVTVLLAASNWIDLLLIGCFGVIFFFRSNRAQRRMVFLYLLMMVVFMLKVSPENRDYALQILGRVTGKYAYLVPPPLPEPKMIDLIEKKEVVAKRKVLGSFVSTLYTKEFTDSLHKKYTGWNYSGRMIAWKELVNFYRDHPGRLLLGTGLGNFSSRIAFKTTALGIDGGYPEQQRYIHPYFRDNHLYIYLYYNSNDQGQHSIVNKPNSVYAQMLGEYGLVGIACFLVFYLGFFIRGIRSRTYGLPLLLLMCAAFLTEYWFEQLSIVVLFEFLMLLDQPAAPDPQPITPNPPTPNWKP